MRAWTPARFGVPLPPGHRFPMAKYAMIAQGVVARGLLPRGGLLEPSRAPRDALTRVHDAGYVDAVLEHGLTGAEQRRLGFPWRHQGNGTARIFADDPAVFTFSMHGAGNYPFRKERSRLDLELPDQTDDEAYLGLLTRHLDAVLEEARADLVVFIAGADPYRFDRLGRLALSIEGLEQRDAVVLAACRRRGLPVAVVLGGGYAADLRDVVTIHANTCALLSASHA